ncbi:MAG: ABC transporter ATP-binding protein [Agromyces sp.]
MTNTPGEYKPSRRDVLRPIEYVGGAAIAAIFTGLVVLITAREPVLALIIAGIAFIVVLMTLALLSMAIKPNAEETAEIDGPDPAGPTAPPSEPPTSPEH